MKKLTAIILCGIMLFSFYGCGEKNNITPDNTENTSQNTNNETDTEIYFLNFKPEVSKVYEEIAAEYKKETGVTVKVVTAASDTYEQTLTSEVAKKDAPTIFQINGPVGYNKWKNYCLDLSNTKLFSYLSDKNLAITKGNEVYGIPYVVEAYGIIYNKDIMDRYFKLTDRQTEINSIEEINNFEKLKAVVEDMTKHKDTLEIEGVFASTSFSGGNHWRWNTHLTNIPLYYEFAENEDYEDATSAGLDAEEITFKYSDNFKNIFDLYTNNSGTEKGLLGSKSIADSMAEFALGKVAMVQNGTWAYKEISDVKGNVVSEDDIGFLPIYTGVKGEENQGLCIGTENYIAINSKVSEEKQEASIEFLEWLFSSEKGKNFVTKELKFISPFTTFGDDDMPDDPLSREAIRWMNKENISSLPWIFVSYPSEVFKEEVSAALLEYVQGQTDWDTVKERITTSWKNER